MGPPEQMGTNVSIETNTALIAAGGLWLASALWVAHRSPLRGALKWLDAFLFLPMLAVLVPPAVWVADQLSPVVLDFVGDVQVASVQSLPGSLKRTFATAVALGLGALIPAGALWGWRRLLEGRQVVSREPAGG